MKPVATVGLLLLALAASPALGHGASKGLHLHVEPEPAAPGARLTVAVDTAEPVRKVTLGWVGGQELRHAPEEPSRHFLLKIQVPEESGAEVLNLQAEAITVSGKTVRAAALVRVGRP